jgi:hypothetical protein
VRVDGVDFFPVRGGGAARECDGRLSFPTANFDDDAVAIVDLRQLEQAVNVLCSLHSRNFVDVGELFHARYIPGGL